MSYRHCITSPTIFYCWLCLLSITIISTADAAALTKDQYVVHGLAEIEPAFDSFEGDMYAGLIPTTLLSDLQNADDSPGKLMFWLFEADNVTNDDAIVIWMNGGPGCSSLSGCLFEHGPVTVPLHPAGFYGTDDDPKTLEPNRYTWTKATRMLYVEQPHGVGFGYGPDPINEMEVGENFYNFLQNFYTIFDTLLDKKLYLFGESYAGMYVPSIAHAIHEGNKKQKTQQLEQSLVTINLQGIGVGNGWIDVMIQGPTVIDYLWWHGMLDMYTARELHQSWENCVGGVPARHPFHNFTTPDECGVGNVALLSAGDDLLDWGTPNVYDITTFDKYTTITSNNGAITKFYNNPKVQDALNVGEHRTWKSCSGQDNGRHLLSNDRPLSMLPYIADLLDDAGIEVLIYNGDRDLLANQPGSEMALNHMQWSGAKGWADVEVFQRGLWVDSPKSVGGYIKTYKNLHLLSVYNSGHMVPYNRPLLALDLITRFINGTSFMDAPIPSFKARYFERAKEGIDDDDFHFYYKFVIAPLILVLGICIGMCITRHRHRKYEGYDELGPAATLS